MRIERGQTLGIVGESGCGKSTTANVMCGLQMPTKGQVFFNGEEVTKRGADARRRIGRVVSVVFQDPATALIRCVCTRLVTRPRAPSACKN